MSPVSFLLHNASLSTQSSKSFYNADLIKFALVITYILESKPCKVFLVLHGSNLPF